jgi:putative ABC transport system ATP-binding protein
MKPDIIFADEPTGNLDSQSGAQVMGILDDLNKNGHTIILVTHETYTAEFADRIIRIKDGMVESDKKVVKPRRSAKEFFK